MHQYQTMPAAEPTVSFPKLILRTVLFVLALAIAIVGVAGVNVYEYSNEFIATWLLRGYLTSAWPKSASIIGLPTAEDECDEVKSIKLGLVLGTIMGVGLLAIVVIMQLVTLCVQRLTRSSCFGGCTYCLLGFSVVGLIVVDVLIVVLYASEICPYGPAAIVTGEPQSYKDLGNSLGPAVGFLPAACIFAVVATCIDPNSVKHASPPPAPVGTNNPLGASQPVSNVSPTAESQASRPAPSPMAKMSL